MTFISKKKMLKKVRPYITKLIKICHWNRLWSRILTFVVRNSFYFIFFKKKKLKNLFLKTKTLDYTKQFKNYIGKAYWYF
jgi:hypothetical protein